MVRSLFLFLIKVCRLAYELLQTKHVDSSERFVSLDDIYYYGGGIGLDQEAIISHKPKNGNELELQAGDKIGVAGNHWNGMSKGTNHRTNKVKETIKLNLLPTTNILFFILQFLYFLCFLCRLDSTHRTRPETYTRR